MTTRHETVLVIAGGDAPAGVEVPRDAFVIAADSGVDHARSLGLRVDVAIGDFDSVSPAGLEWAERVGARIVRHEQEKDATDLELALDAALELGPDRILVVGAGGGRLDHFLANLLLLGAERFGSVSVDAYVGSAHVCVVRGERTIVGRPGELVTLLPVNGPARGVTTAGLVYPLDDATLEPGSSRGVSNVLAGPEARVAVGSGVLLVIQPEGVR
jgi:thiamine pyrophosphokinase